MAKSKMPSIPAHRLIKVVDGQPRDKYRQIRGRCGVVGDGMVGRSNALSREIRRRLASGNIESSLPHRDRAVVKSRISHLTPDVLA